MTFAQPLPPSACATYTSASEELLARSFDDTTPCRPTWASV